MQFTTANGVVHHYQVIGGPEGKPTFVFVNSLGTDFRIWRDVIVKLVGEYGIVLYDKRGHGLSALGETPYKVETLASDLAGLLDGLGVDNAIVVGLSVGGLIAQCLVRERPDLVRALVLIGTAAKIGDDAMWPERIAAVKESGVAPLLDGVMAKWFTPAFHQNRPDDLAGYRTMVERQPQAGYVATCEALRDADLRVDAPDIKVPTICVVGDQDGSTPPKTVLELARSIPDARYEVIQGAAHIPCVETPDYLVEIIRAFLKDAEIA